MATYETDAKKERDKVMGQDFLDSGRGRGHPDSYNHFKFNDFDHNTLPIGIRNT